MKIKSPSGGFFYVWNLAVTDPFLSICSRRATDIDVHLPTDNGISCIVLSDKKKTDKIEKTETRAFKEVAIEWHATNKKWSKDHRNRVLKTLQHNLFLSIGKCNIAELKNPRFAGTDQSSREVRAS